MCCTAACLLYGAVSYMGVFVTWRCVLYGLYGVAMISRMLKNTRLFAEYRSLLKSSFAKEKYIFKHPTNRSHPIAVFDL